MAFPSSPRQAGPPHLLRAQRQTAAPGCAGQTGRAARVTPYLPTVPSLTASVQSQGKDLERQCSARHALLPSQEQRPVPRWQVAAAVCSNVCFRERWFITRKSQPSFPPQRGEVPETIVTSHRFPPGLPLPCLSFHTCLLRQGHLDGTLLDLLPQTQPRDGTSGFPC